MQREPETMTSQTMGRVSSSTSSNGKFNLKTMMESFRSRVLMKSIDAAIIAQLKPAQPTFKQFKMIFSLRSSNHARVASVVNLLNIILPGASQRVSRALCRFNHLPFAITNVRLMNYGSGSSVFLLDTEDGYKVLKVYRRSLGRTGEDLLQITNVFKRKYETVSSWYDGPYRFVPPATFLILHGPALDAPAAAALQSYIPGEKKDLFLDFTDDDLVTFLQQETGLKEQFLFFAHKTLEIYTQQGLCLDFIGRENLMMVKNGSEYQLFIIDYGIFNLEKIRASSPELFSQITAYLNRLSAILIIINQGGNQSDRLEIS